MENDEFTLDSRNRAFAKNKLVQ